MKVLAYTAEKQGDNVSFTCSNGEKLITANWYDAITFLLESCQYAVVYQIDSFTELFCSLLPKQARDKLAEEDRVVLDNGEKIFYSAGRQLSIGYGWRGNERNEVDLYGLSRYTDKEITDVQELIELWEDVVSAFCFFDIVPQKLASPIGVYEECLDAIPFARACDLPNSADPMLDKSSGIAWEEWRGLYKLGHWNAEEVSDLDISSAYPSLIAQLPDLRGSTFFTSETMPDRFTWGLLDGEVEIKADHTYFPMGKYPAVITTGQLRQIRQYKWGYFKLNKGYFIKIPSNPAYPFKEVMANLYEARQSDNELVGRIAKAISVGIGGKFNSRYGNKVGRNYQPIYAKMITSGCEMKVASLIWDKALQDRLISVTVDGVLVESDKPMAISENGMGSWRVNKPSPFLVLSLLYQWGNEKHPDGHYYPEITQMIKDNPDTSIYGDLDFNLLEYDRHFEKLPKTGGELLANKYGSKPIEGV